jgi:nucleoside 2-deoxyribosyltransferase
LIGVSGGQGVEQLAVEYSSKGKPVIPLDINVGASLRDGAGGASRLFERALANPDDFCRVTPGNSAASLLDQTRTRNGARNVEDVIASLLSLLHALTPPRAFYVRLLNDALTEYPSVENFFRSTVDSLVKELGYEPLQMGLGKNEFAWMNQAIFDSLHHSSVVVVDLTGLRPNCFMELGYAFGNKQRVIVTTRDDTKISFDAFALEAFRWKDGEDSAAQLDRFRTHWERNINMPNLVRQKEAK